MSRRLKVGVVGGGVGASHIAAFQELPDLYEVAAFCDINAEKAQAVGNKFGIGKVVTDYDALLALDLDLIDVVTPPNLHVEQASKALRAGRDVVVEKPAASSLADLDRLAEVERASGRRVNPIFQYRFGNGLGRLRHLMAKGLVGKPYVATIETHWRRTPEYYAKGPWRGRWKSELGGCLAGHAIHIHDLMTQTLGPVASVYARTAARVNPIETEDCAMLALELQNGAFVTSSVTLGAQNEISRMRLVFDGLTAESALDPYNPAYDPWTFIVADPDGQKAVDVALADYVPTPQRFTGQFWRLHKALTTGSELPVTLADARASIELLSASYWSARTGEAVKLPLGRGHPFYNGWVETMLKAAS